MIFDIETPLVIRQSGQETFVQSWMTVKVDAPDAATAGRMYEAWLRRRAPVPHERYENGDDILCLFTEKEWERAALTWNRAGSGQ